MVGCDKNKMHKVISGATNFETFRKKMSLKTKMERAYKEIFNSKLDSDKGREEM